MKVQRPNLPPDEQAPAADASHPVLVALARLLARQAAREALSGTAISCDTNPANPSADSSAKTARRRARNLS